MGGLPADGGARYDRSMFLRKRGRRARWRRRELRLAPAWRAWVTDNLLRGAHPVTLVEALAERGLSPVAARREVAAVLASPIYAAARPHARQAARLEMVARVKRACARLDPGGEEVERVAHLDASSFFARYYVPNRPVVLTDLIEPCPARQVWSMAWLGERYGAVEVEICDGRDAEAKPDMHFERLRRETTLGAMIRRIEATESSNDFYMVANNHSLERPELEALLDDVRLRGGFLSEARPKGSACLWLGPAGTVTPLHHDKNNILFCQLVGRKRVRLISPLEPALLDELDGVYSPIDCEAPDLERHPGFEHVQVKEVVLEPGEAVFLPIGWWHHLRALEASVSISFTCFDRPNSFEWYAPGSIGVAR